MKERVLMAGMKTGNQQAIVIFESMMDQVAGRDFGDEYLDEQANVMTAIQEMLAKLYDGERGC